MQSATQSFLDASGENEIPEPPEPPPPELVAAAGVAYIHIPVDFAAPSRADLDAFADAMDANEGRTVHVHCAANYRVSAFYGLYAQRKGWSLAEAERWLGPNLNYNPAKVEAAE